MRRRKGLTRVTSAIASPNGRYFEDFYGILPFTNATNQWNLIVGGRTSIGKLDGNALVKLPHEQGTTFTDVTKPWSFVVYKGIAYGCRPSAGTIQRITADQVDDSGIDAPATAATLADGGGGNLAAGDYIGVVTFYNSVTAAESNPSDNSATLALGASKQIDWSAIPTSSQAQVNARRLYRTLADQEGEYFLVTTISDNITTTFTDNVIDSGLGREVSFDNGAPPASALFNEIFQERHWVSDSTSLYFSQLGLPEQFSEFDFLNIAPDDGQDLTGLLNHGDRLLIGKTDSIYFATTIDGFNFRIQNLSTRHGVRSHASMISVEGLAIWFGGDNFYVFTGSSVEAIGDTKIRTLVDSVDPDEYDLITAALDPVNSLYMATFPTLGKMAIYNYRTNTWGIYTFRGADSNAVTCPTVVVSGLDVDEQQIAYSNLQDGDGDSIFKFGVGETDDGRDIECEWHSKLFGFDNPVTAKFLSQVSLNATPVAEEITVEAIRDDGVSVGSATINLFSTRQWFRVPLATNGSPGAGWSVKLTYTGTKTVDLLGLNFVVTDLERRLPPINTV